MEVIWQRGHGLRRESEPAATHPTDHRKSLPHRGARRHAGCPDPGPLPSCLPYGEHPCPLRPTSCSLAPREPQRAGAVQAAGGCQAQGTRVLITCGDSTDPVCLAVVGGHRALESRAGGLQRGGHAPATELQATGRPGGPWTRPWMRLTGTRDSQVLRNSGPTWSHTSKSSAPLGSCSAT